MSYLFVVILLNRECVLCTQSVGKITNTLANTQTPTSLLPLAIPHPSPSRERKTSSSERLRHKERGRLTEEARKTTLERRNFPPDGKFLFREWKIFIPPVEGFRSTCDQGAPHPY